MSTNLSVNFVVTMLQLKKRYSLALYKDFLKVPSNIYYFPYACFFVERDYSHALSAQECTGGFSSR